MLGMPNPAVMPQRSSASMILPAPVARTTVEGMGEEDIYLSPVVQTGFLLQKIRDNGASRGPIVPCSLEGNAQAELQGARAQGRGKAERRISSNVVSMHVEGGKAGQLSKVGPHRVIDAGKVQAIGQVEAFRHQLQTGLFAQPEFLCETHIEVNEVGSLAGIACCPDRAVIGGMAIAIHVSTSQQVEGVPAVIAENGREDESGQSPRPAIGCLQYRSRHNLMALIEFRERALSGQVQVVLRAEVAVEVKGRVICLAVGVIAEQAYVRAKALLNFDDPAFIERRPL